DSVYLFVVNHPHYKSTVEIFKFAEEENVLVHVKPLNTQRCTSTDVNNIVPVGPESFYATNDYYFSDFIMRHVEMVFGLTLTNVVYYSPGEVREVAAGILPSKWNCHEDTEQQWCAMQNCKEKATALQQEHCCLLKFAKDQLDNARRLLAQYFVDRRDQNRYFWFKQEAF
ncbi:unnamed protein product, partial [Ranitomeya imitator]